MCISPPPKPPNQPQYHRIVYKTSRCWIKLHHDVAALFVEVLNIPDPTFWLVPAPLIHTIFETYSPLGWKKYFKAWKDGFGYGSVPDDGTAGWDIVYNANVVWAQDYRLYGQQWQPGQGDPMCCELQCACKQCPCSSGWQ